MMARSLGNSSLTHFDVLIVGSGAGGSAAAEMLTRLGKKVLILEAGSNYFENLDDPNLENLKNHFSNDEIKMTRRNLIQPDPLTEPRTFRSNTKKIRSFVGDVNYLPKTVGGGSVHADMKTPRFHPDDFKMASNLGEVSKANFADWPIEYDQLEKFYCNMENILGVQGKENATPFDPPRSKPYPMPPGVPMLVGLLGSEGATKLGYHPFPYPTAVNSRPYDGRPACVDCGFCSAYGCPTSAKGSAAVTALRRALLTGHCLLLSETRVQSLLKKGSQIVGVKALDPEGKPVVFQADQYVLAASPIEDARLLLLSEVGNSNGLVGKNLMFHYQTYAIGIFNRRLHSHRGRSVTHGILDFRGSSRDKTRPLGGIVEIGGEGSPIDEAINYSGSVGIKGRLLKKFMGESPLRDRLMALIMQGEDAPQLTNSVDLDPDYRDIDGLPVPRVTYKNHNFEISAKKYYSPKLLDVIGAAGASYGFIAPDNSPATSRHVMGTLRFGNDPRTSVCDSSGRLHDLDNLYAADGSLFPTSSGLNPTLTIMALASRIAAGMVFPTSPERGLNL
jgi:choline dehydrogenase-like flavoprotein